MGLTLPGYLTEPMGWVGLEWPQADEDLLREAGQQWIDFGMALDQAAIPATAAAQQVWGSSSGDVAEAFREFWTEDDGPHQRLSDDAKAALLIGGALLAFAAITLITKLSIIAQLAWLLASVAAAVAGAFFTFGASLSAGAAFTAAARAAVRKLLTQLLEHVTKLVREVFEQARSLLKRAKNVRNVLRRGPEIPGGPIPPRLTAPRYTGKPMNPHYRYETELGHPDNPFPGHAVRRLSPEELEQRRIYVDQDGLLRNVHDSSVVDTSDAGTHFSHGRAIFVQDEAGNIYVSKEQKLGVFHHSTLGGGDPVAAAGEIKVTNGRLEHVTAASGHYRPGLEQMQQFVAEMGSRGVTDVQVYDFHGRNRWI